MTIEITDGSTYFPLSQLASEGMRSLLEERLIAYVFKFRHEDKK